MSKYKFHLINSNSKILRRVKNDLWGTVLFTKKKNKFRRIYTKLYDKRQRRIKQKFRKKRLKKLVFFQNKVFYLNKYNYFYKKKKIFFMKLYFFFLKKIIQKKLSKKSFFFVLKLMRSFFKIKKLNFIKLKKNFLKKKIVQILTKILKRKKRRKYIKNQSKLLNFSDIDNNLTNKFKFIIRKNYSKLKKRQPRKTSYLFKKIKFFLKKKKKKKKIEISFFF